MPISNKITEHVKAIKASKSEKKLMEDILALEDRGTFRYVAEYEKIISEYIKKNKVEVSK